MPSAVASLSPRIVMRSNSLDILDMVIDFLAGGTLLELLCPGNVVVEDEEELLLEEDGEEILLVFTDSDEARDDTAGITLSLLGRIIICSFGDHDHSMASVMEHHQHL